MDDLYLEHILDHAENPRGRGKLDDPTYSTNYTNTACGDTVTIDIDIKNGTIRDVKWRGEGCVISQASASLLSEKLIGVHTNDLQAWTDDEVLEMLGLPEVSFARRKCALAFFWGAKSLFSSSFVS